MLSVRITDRYIFNIFPLPHVLILLLLLTVTLRIAFGFHFHYVSRPLLTLCVVASLLGSISDSLAQMIEVIRSRQRAGSKSKDGILDGDIELDEKSPNGSPRMSVAWDPMERTYGYDFPRVIRFMAYGFLFSPIAVFSLNILKIDFKVCMVRIFR
jgi:hypothetical protein